MFVGVLLTFIAHPPWWVCILRVHLKYASYSLPFSYRNVIKCIWIAQQYFDGKENFSYALCFSHSKNKRWNKEGKRMMLFCLFEGKVYILILCISSMHVSPFLKALMYKNNSTRFNHQYLYLLFKVHFCCHSHNFWDSNGVHYVEKVNKGIRERERENAGKTFCGSVPGQENMFDGQVVWKVRQGMVKD